MVTKQGKRPLAEVLRGVPGQWVAIDRLTNELQAVSDSPDTLMAEIRTRRLVNINGVVRAPDPSEPELVGLGLRLAPLAPAFAVAVPARGQQYFRRSSSP